MMLSQFPLRHFRPPAIVGTLLRFALIGLLAVAIFGPLLNMLIWTVAEAWYFPAKLPQRWISNWLARVVSRAMTEVPLLASSCSATLTSCSQAFWSGRVP